MWFTNNKTGVTFEIDDVTMKGKVLKYTNLIKRLKDDNDYIIVDDPATQAKQKAADDAEKAEFAELRAEKKARQKTEKKTVAKK